MADQSTMDSLLEGGDYLIDPPETNSHEDNFSSYTARDEGMSRGAASRIVQNATKNNPQPDHITPQIQAILKQNKELQEKMNSWEQKFGNIENQTNELRSTQEAATYKALTDDILRQEEDLIKDPIHSQFFDREKIRPIMFQYWKGDKDKGIEGKNLTPYEANAIVNYPELTREVLAYRKKFKEISDSRNMQFSSDANANAPIDEIASVRNAPRGKRSEAATRLAMQRADRLL